MRPGDEAIDVCALPQWQPLINKLKDSRFSAHCVTAHVRDAISVPAQCELAQDSSLCLRITFAANAFARSTPTHSALETHTLGRSTVQLLSTVQLQHTPIYLFSRAHFIAELCGWR